MATADPLNVNPIAPFHCGEAAGIGERWTRWLRSFELYLTGKGITVAERKRALLLHCAGLEVQDIFFTLEEEAAGENETVYDQAKKTLEKYFNPQSNVPYERLLFRNMAQNESETIEQYITRLRQKAVTCNFDKVDEEIRDQVINKCISHTL